MAGIAAVTRQALRCCSSSCSSSRKDLLESHQRRLLYSNQIVRAPSNPARATGKVRSCHPHFIGKERLSSVSTVGTLLSRAPAKDWSSSSKFGLSLFRTSRDVGSESRGFRTSKFGVKLSQRGVSRICNARLSGSRYCESIEGSRSVSTSVFGGGLGGKSNVVDKRKLLYGLGGSLPRNVLVRSSAAAGAANFPSSRAPGSDFFSKTLAVFAGFSAHLQRIRIGWLDLWMIMKIIFVALAGVGAVVAGRRAYVEAKRIVSEHADDGGEQGDGGPMQVLARGATCIQSNMGPWSLSDLVLGLTAMSKVTEKEPPESTGQEVKDLPKDPGFLQRAQHWRSVSEAVYAPDRASFSLFSHLAESTLVGAEWAPCQESFRPAYAVFIDVPYGAVVLAVRGTAHVIDMLVNSSASAEDFGQGGGKAHLGFIEATNALYEEVLPHIEKAFKDLGGKPNMKLVITGHSMGGAVGALIGLKLRDKYPDLECWAYCPPASVTLDLAKECKSFTTSFVSAFDIVPRFSLHSVEKLRAKIQEFNFDDVERVAKHDEDWQNMKKALETVRKLQEYHKDAMGKMETETGKKMMDSGTKALESETGQQVKGLAQDATDKAYNVVDGTDEGDKKKEESKERAPPPPPLFPPGKLLLLRSDPPGCGKLPEMRSDMNPQRQYGSYPTFDESKNISWRMFEAKQEDIDEILVSPWIISDHMLGNMCEGISYFQARCDPALPTK